VRTLFEVQTLLKCERFGSADVFEERTPLRCGRFYSADAFTVRTLLPCGRFTVRTLLQCGRFYHADAVSCPLVPRRSEDPLVLVPLVLRRSGDLEQNKGFVQLNLSTCTKVGLQGRENFNTEMVRGSTARRQ